MLNKNLQRLKYISWVRRIYLINTQLEQLEMYEIENEVANEIKHSMNNELFLNIFFFLNKIQKRLFDQKLDPKLFWTILLFQDFWLFCFKALFH